MYKFLGSYDVVPSLPENLEKFREVAYNLYWTWNQDTRELFRRLHMDLWEETNHNPVMMLGRISQERLNSVSHDDGFRLILKEFMSSFTIISLKSYGTKKIIVIIRIPLILFIFLQSLD